MALLAGFCLVVGLPLAAMAGPTPGGADGDSDGVENAFDNCTVKINADQKDVDHDGCGDTCDADFDQNGASGVTDFGILKSSFLKSTGDPAYNAAADMDCNGSVGIPDFGLFKNEFLTTAGPSGIRMHPTWWPARSRGTFRRLFWLIGSTGSFGITEETEETGQCGKCFQ
jgi:hypothetical protein